jgi:hypothetical protein
MQRVSAWRRRQARVHPQTRLWQNVLHKLLRHFEHKLAVGRRVLHRRNGRRGVHVAGHVVAAHLVPNARGALIVANAADAQAPQVGGAQRLHDEVEAQLVAVLLRHRQARAVDGNGRADGDARCAASRKGGAQRRKLGLPVKRRHRRLALHDACGCACARE